VSLLLRQLFKSTSNGEHVRVQPDIIMQNSWGLTFGFENLVIAVSVRKDDRLTPSEWRTKLLAYMTINLNNESLSDIQAMVHRLERGVRRCAFEGGSQYPATPYERSELRNACTGAAAWRKPIALQNARASNRLNR
jgi:hypothetical protein